MSHYNLAHKFIPMPQAMKIPDAKAAVDKEWKELETIPAMDICHLENAGLQPKLQKYKGRVVLRGDIVKDDSGACAVFTEQGLVCVPDDCCKNNERYCKITSL